jgi:antitoxin component of RelBE/YafQ-DinJ toxin-antitoxin module
MNDVLMKIGLDITTAVSLVLLAAFLIAGAAIPFLSPQRKARR